MSSLQLGPVAISMDMALFIFGVLVALGVGALMARGRKLPITDTLLALVLVSLLVARVVFVLRYWPEYFAHPGSIIDIRDGGFDAVGGLVGMAVYASWLVWRRPALRTPLAAAVVAGLVCWSVAGGVLGLVDHTRPTRPEVQLTHLDGDSVQLDDLAAAHPGQPMVVNLWASWCPPCRREMPMLGAAQAQHGDVVFVFANQGEPAATVNRFLRTQSLSLSNVLLDTHQRLARAMDVQAFPTTLFFNADGQLVDTHMGMLSAATLARSLNQLATESSESDSS